jgi:hypothetical protein
MPTAACRLSIRQLDAYRGGISGFFCVMRLRCSLKKVAAPAHGLL